MEYRIEWDVSRGLFMFTTEVKIPVEVETKKAKKLALKNYKLIKRMYRPKAIRLYKDATMLKGWQR